MVEGVGQLDYGLTERDGACGARWGKGTIVTYAKFYVNPPGSQPLPHQNRQAIVRPGPYQPLGPVSVRRRSAAQGCANAHPDRATTGGRLGPSSRHRLLARYGSSRAVMS